MSATILNDISSISTSGGGGGGDSQSAADGSLVAVESAQCECCGLTEECTPPYIARVRDRHGGRWICGLCAEAVGDEICRSGRVITTEEALDLHMAFCNKFRTSSPPANSTGHLISAVRHLLRRSLDSPRSLPSAPNSPRRDSDGEVVVVSRRAALSRSESCFPTLAR